MSIKPKLKRAYDYDSIVSSRLDYANALLHGMSDRNLLQLAQNSLARVVCQAPVLQVPLSYDSSFTGCRFANELPTRYH